MGMQQTIRFPAGQAPTWPMVQSRLAEHGCRVALRMIDGLPAFPDEEPQDSWTDLRLGFDSGMVTIRRSHTDSWTLIVWGNADAELIRAWGTCAEVVASFGGTIDA